MQLINSKTNLTEIIGNTPLIELDLNISNLIIRAKLETHNLTGSIKDRMAMYMLQQAFTNHEIDYETTILEATTGNTGIAFAALAAMYGLPVILVMPENSSRERVQMMTRYGARVILTPEDQGPAGAISERDKLATTIDKVWVPNQFGNPANVQAHIQGIGQEIVQQTQGQVDYLVHGVGTGGTLMGVAQALKVVNPKLKVVAVEPTESSVLSGSNSGNHGIQGIGEGFVPDIVDLSLIDEVITVATTEAKQATHVLAKQGLLVGISSGANLVAMDKLGQNIDSKTTVVTIFADRGERYLSVEV